MPEEIDDQEAATREPIDGHMTALAERTRAAVQRFILWLEGPGGRAHHGPRCPGTVRPDASRGLTVFSQFDLFSDGLTERSEHGFGLGLADLEGLAADALGSAGGRFDPPPAFC